MGLIRITDRNSNFFLQGIQDIEKGVSYPLGNDTFQIDHGSDYFRFFQRLGDLFYYVWKEEGQVAAVSAGVLRRVPLKEDGRLYKAWYLCDLKVHKNFRGKRIPLRMLSKSFLSNYLKCQRGYAISMNSPQQRENRMAKLLRSFRWASIEEVSSLLIWSVDGKTMTELEPILERHRGPVSYLSLRGVKDIVLDSTQKPLPLLHVQFGPLADPNASDRPHAEAVHMFASPENDLLSQELSQRGVQPSATATVISHRMKSCHWKWILTSDI